MSLFLSTVSADVTINDLKGYTFVHPTVDYNLLQRFTLEDLVESTDLQTAVTAGTVIIKNVKGTTVTSVSTTDYMLKSEYDNNDDGKIDADSSQVESVNGQTGIVNVTDPTFSGTTAIAGSGIGNVPDDGVLATGARALFDDGLWKSLTGSVSTFSGTSAVVGANNGLVPDDGVTATGNRLLADNGSWVSLGGAKSMILTFAGGSAPYVESTATTYSVVAKFIYAGSDAIGTINSILANIWVTSGNADVRIFDATNSLQIAEVTAISATIDSNIVDFGTLSNIPIGSSVIEIQAKKNGGGAKLRISGIEIQY